MKIANAIIIKWGLQVVVLWLVFVFYGFSLSSLATFGLLMAVLTFIISDYLAFSFMGNGPAAVVDGVLVFLAMLLWASYTVGLNFAIVAAIIFYGCLISAGEWFVHQYVIYPLRRGGRPAENVGYE